VRLLLNEKHFCNLAILSRFYIRTEPLTTLTCIADSLLSSVRVGVRQRLILDTRNQDPVKRYSIRRSRWRCKDLSWTIMKKRTADFHCPARIIDFMSAKKVRRKALARASIGIIDP
jgi:hypothetical protein